MVLKNLKKPDKIKHYLVRPKIEDYKNPSNHFQDVCKYLVLKFEDTYKK